MKSIFLIITLCFFAQNVNADSSAVTNKNMLKLRKGPSSSAISMWAYPVGEAVKIIEKSDNGQWYKVHVPSDGRNGYMWSDYLTLNQGAVMPSAELSKNKNQTVAVVVQPEFSEKGWKAKYEQVALELKEKTIELEKLKLSLITAKKEINEAKQIAEKQKVQLASFEKVRDLRLVSMLEATGQTVFLENVGVAKMATLEGWVAFQIPLDNLSKAKAAFESTEHNFHLIGNSGYFTMESKNILSRKAS